VRTLPQRILPETWAAIVSEVVAGGKGLTESLPQASESLLEMSSKGPDSDKSVSDGLEKVLSAIRRSKEETGKPLQLIVDAMIRELGAGERACRFSLTEGRGGMLSMCPAASVSAVTIVVDEANIAFSVGPTTKDSDVDETKTALEYFTSSTKQQLKVRSMRFKALSSMARIHLCCRGLAACTGQRDLGFFRACLSFWPHKGAYQLQPRQLL
jgi:hypothetical protein